jgi:hypothetical protein
MISIAGTMPRGPQVRSVISLNPVSHTTKTLKQHARSILYTSFTNVSYIDNDLRRKHLTRPPIMGKSNSKGSVPKPIQSAAALESLNKKSAQLSNSTNPQDDSATPSPGTSTSKDKGHASVDHQIQASHDASIDPSDDPVYAQNWQSRTDPSHNHIPHQRRASHEESSDPSDHPDYAKGWQSRTDPAHNPIPHQRKASHEESSDPSDHPDYAKGWATHPTTAQSRLAQLSSQLTTSPNPPETASSVPPANSKARRRALRKSKDPSADLPADYSDILTHLSTMRRIALTPSPIDRGYTRQKSQGKLWVRERIEKLLLPNTWTEIGSVAGTATWTRDLINSQSEHVESFIPSNNPQGFGLVRTASGPRTIYLTADDFSVRAGHADGSVGAKTKFGEKMALKLRIPVVKLVDGSSGGGSVTTIKTQGYAYLPHTTILFDAVRQLNMGIPNLGAAVGPAIGLGAARVVSTHFNCMAADVGSMFNAGPKVVEGATFEEGLSFADLGGPGVHGRNGTFDNVAKDEEDCFEMIRTVLGFLPDCGALQAPPVVECVDDVMREDIALRSIIPRRKNRMYDPYYIINSVMDEKSWFEIGNMWGRTSICGLARLGGRPVGVISNNCEANGGALDAQGSQKLMKHIKFW